jgi:hemolysin activation/secretion protein
LAGPAVPNAGTILQQVKPSAPASPANDAHLQVEQTKAAELPASAPFPVTSIRIVGNTKIDTATLHGLVADAEGRQLTLTELGEMAARITRYYRSEGYLLARAFIPAQEIQAGIATIAISEARYGSISLDNRSRTLDRPLLAMLAPLHSGEVIAANDLDRALLLLSDVPGVVTKTTLKPGSAVGTADLQVAAASAPALSGNVALDNYGSRYTGRTRLGAAVNIYNPLHYGDVLGLSGVSSADGMNYGHIAYESALNGYGTRAGAAYSALGYKLGGTLSELDADGTARVQSLWAMQPLLRSGDANLRTQIQYDHLQLRDHIDVSATRTDRTQENWKFGVSGDVRDSLLSSAINAWSLGWTAGRVGFDDADAKLTDADSANTQGSFTKWNASISRLQSVGADNTLYLTLSGQWANSNLDSSQKMTLGGPYSVRAYDVGVVSGDTGYLGSVEFRHTVGQAWRGQWQTVVFADTAHVTVNKSTWSAGTNDATLSGAGLGLKWIGNNFGQVSANVATPIGPTPVLVGSTSSVRAWLEMSASF